jgi:bifunctional DNA-binding transcriptional regulator/antitoxin component of YhaV-PrlF toxin-antitoxin module
MFQTVDMKELNLGEIVCIEETAITIRAYRRRTTVPSKIFKFMGLKEGDILRWIATKDGTVFVKKIEQKKDEREEK